MSVFFPYRRSSIKGQMLTNHRRRRMADILNIDEQKLNRAILLEFFVFPTCRSSNIELGLHHMLTEVFQLSADLR